MYTTVDNLETNLVPIPASSVTAAVSGVTAAPSITDTAEYVRASVLGGDVNMTSDGTTPSATAGFPLFAGSTALMRRATWQASKWFPTSGSPTLFATGFTRP